MAPPETALKSMKPNTNTDAAETVQIGSDQAVAPSAICSAWPSIPDGWGYYWVDKGDGDIRMMCLQPGKEWEKDGRSVEAWKCPGESRYRLDAQKMPKWKWLRIPLPNYEASDR